MSDVFTLSIETAPMVSEPHGFHLGTIESVARGIAEEMFWARGAHSVALKRGGEIFDVYDGEWISEQDIVYDI